MLQNLVDAFMLVLLCVVVSTGFLACKRSVKEPQAQDMFKPETWGEIKSGETSEIGEGEGKTSLEKQE